MAEIPTILDHHLSFDPAADFDAFAKSAPAKWVVYLLADADSRPIQLLCVKNLRYSLRHRLGGEETIGLTKRVNYRDIVRRIYYRRVDSAFEADWIYYEAAKQVFPESYQGMIGFRPAWFIHVNPKAQFPRYIKTIDLTNKAGNYIGPLEDKHAAARLIELVEDWFDLCRYYNLLVESPHARACAYKEMGKCPAPCDGSISIEQYRRMIEWSARTIVDPDEFLRDQTKRMQQAATEMRYEMAGKIKSYTEQLSQLGKGPFRHVHKLADFCFISMQRAPRQNQAKIFLITPGQIEEPANVINDLTHPAELLRTILLAADHCGQPTSLDSTAAERIGIVTHHLFSNKQTHGVFLPLHDVTEKAMQKAFKDLQKQKLAEETEGEGVVKELQAM